MSEQPITLLTLNPRNMITGALVTVRLAGGGSAGYKQFGSTDWKAGLGGAPAIVQRLGFDGNGFSEGASTIALSLAYLAASLEHAKTMKGYYWPDAPFTLHSGPDGGADGDMMLRLTGRVTDTTGVGADLNIGLADLNVDYAKPVIKATFAGTGGIEGDAEMKGKPKKRAWGALFNVSADSLLKAQNIHVVSDPAHPILAFDQIYDRGNGASSLALVPWAGSIDATLNALIASVAPAGGAAIAPSIASFKWWHGNPGKLTCDIRGTIGGGYGDRPVDVAARVLETAAPVNFDLANINQFRLDRNYQFGWLVSDISSTAASEVQAMLSGISSWFAVGATGVIRFGTYSWGAPVAALTSASTEIVRSHAPVTKISLGYRTNQTVMARGDIAEVVFAADVSGLGALATQNSVDFVSQILPAGKPEPLADVTMIVTSPPPIAVPYNFDGTVKINELPKTLNFKLIRGAGLDVTTLANWSAVLKSGSAAFSIGAATGVLEITSLASDAVFEVSASYLGTIRKGQSAAVRKVDDPPVMTGGGSGGATSDATASIAPTTSSAYAGAQTRILPIAAGAGGVVNLAYPGEFSRATNGSANAAGKWQWRVVGGTWADIAGEIASSTPATKTGAPEPDNTRGTILVNQQKTGLSAGVTYEFQLLLRGSVAVTLNWIGNASGAGG
jgi:hypothetical protein